MQLQRATCLMEVLMPSADRTPEPDIRTQVLIVDDFDDALVIYRDYLTFKGIRVLTARSGAEAIELAREHRPDVIFLDIRMALMTGTQAMQILRRDPSFSATPIVALTAQALEEERVAAMEAGFDEVISKPCFPDDLFAAIERLSQKARDRG
jgi:two-component system cell cycle response regulator DivK